MARYIYLPWFLKMLYKQSHRVCNLLKLALFHSVYMRCIHDIVNLIVETLKKIKNPNKMLRVHKYNEITISYKEELIIY